MKLDKRPMRIVPAAVRRQVTRERTRSGNVPAVNPNKDRRLAGKARIRARRAPSTLDIFTCSHCGHQMGIVGRSTGSDEDMETDRHFAEEVARHESGECVGADR